jgi:hypothetical protein
MNFIMQTVLEDLPGQAGAVSTVTALCPKQHLPQGAERFNGLTAVA